MCFYQFVAIIHNYTCGGIDIYIERGWMLHSFHEQGEGPYRNEDMSSDQTEE